MRGIDGPLLARRLALSDIGFNVAVSFPDGGRHEIGNGVAVLMACGPHQSAVERDILRHGIFTYHLLRVLDERADGAPAGVPIGVVGYAQVVQAVLAEVAAAFTELAQTI